MPQLTQLKAAGKIHNQILLSLQCTSFPRTTPLPGQGPSPGRMGRPAVSTIIHSRRYFVPEAAGVLAVPFFETGFLENSTIPGSLLCAGGFMGRHRCVTYIHGPAGRQRDSSSQKGCQCQVKSARVFHVGSVPGPVLTPSTHNPSGGIISVLQIRTLRFREVK